MSFVLYYSFSPERLLFQVGPDYKATPYCAPTKTVIDENYASSLLQGLGSIGVFLTEIFPDFKDKHADFDCELTDLHDRVERSLNPFDLEAVLAVCDRTREIYRRVISCNSNAAGSQQQDVLDKILKFLEEDHPTLAEIGLLYALLAENKCQAVQVYHDLPDAVRVVCNQFVLDKAEIKRDYEELTDTVKQKASRDELQEVRSQMQLLMSRVESLEGDNVSLKNKNSVLEAEVKSSESENLKTRVERSERELKEKNVILEAKVKSSEKEKAELASENAKLRLERNKLFQDLAAKNRRWKIAVCIGIPVVCVVGGVVVGLVLGPAGFAVIASAGKAVLGGGLCGLGIGVVGSGVAAVAISAMEKEKID